jgi:hypothetical protein
MEGDGIPRSGTPQPGAGPDLLVEGLGRTSLTEGNMPMENPTAPPSGETPLSGASIPARAAISSVSTRMSTYEELPGHHLRSTMDLVASTPASDYRDSTETPKTEPHVTASQHRNPCDDLQWPHIPPSYYYFGAPDSGSADDTHDPTRECFNIDVESTS